MQDHYKLIVICLLMPLKCVHCGIRRDYYPTRENAMRQNCRVSDSGYHLFQTFVCCWFKRSSTSSHQQLLERRSKKRPATI